MKRGKKGDDDRPAGTRRGKRVSPVEEVDMFTYSTGTRDVLASNFLENTERLSKYMLTTFGELGKMIKLRRYPEIPRQVVDPVAMGMGTISNKRVLKLQALADQEWLKEVMKMSSNKVKMYGLLMQLVTEEGEERIKGTTENWDEIERECDPLGLWKAIIVTHGMRTDDLSEHEAKRSARINYQKCYQVQGESLLSYTNRFRQCIAILSAVGENVPEDSAASIDYLEGLDKRQYGEMLRDIKNRARNKITEFPADLSAAHVFARNYIQPYMPSVRRSEHVNATVYQAVSAEPYAAARKSKCETCGRFHFGVCWGKDKERSPYPPSNASVNVLHANNKKDAVEPSVDGDGEPFYSVTPTNNIVDGGIDGVDDYYDITPIMKQCMKCTSIVGSNMHNNTIVFLDSCSNENVFHNVDLLCNVEDSGKDVIRIKGIGGVTETSTTGCLPGFGEVYVLDDKNKINILSLSLVEDRFDVKLEDHAFVVQIDDEMIIKFKRMDNNLWGCDFANITHVLRDKFSDDDNIKVYTVETVSEQEAKYTAQEVRKAKEARMIMQELGYPSTRDMIKMMVKGLMINLPITPHDVIRAEKIYGPDVASLKGKTVKRKLKKSEQVIVPRNMMKQQKMFSDIFYWRGISFMLTLVLPLRIKFVTAITKRETKGYLKSILENHIGRIKDHGFNVSAIYVDPQRALAALDGMLGVPLDTTGARQHVSNIERHIRIVKERLRSIECGLPFKCPLRLVPGMVHFVVSRLNLFTASEQKDGISPKESYTGVKPDYNKDVRGIAFGTYVQAHEDFDTLTNLPRERTRGCIALYPKGNAGGAWKFYSLRTNQEITRDHWTVLAMPDIVIDRLNVLYSTDEHVQDLIRAPLDEVVPQVRGVDDMEPPVGGVNDLIEPEIFNNQPQFRDVESEEGGDVDRIFENGHENEGINLIVPEDERVEEDPGDIVSKKMRAQDAVNRIFKPAEQMRVVPNEIFVNEQELNIPERNEMGLIDVNGVRRSSRLIGKRRYVNIIRREDHNSYAMAITRTQAYKLYATEAEKAAIKEISQVYERGTLKIIDRETMTLLQLRKLIRSAVIFDAKHDMNGNFERLKARLVARGNEMDTTLYEDTTSPTIATIHVMILLAVAAKERRKLRVLDIGNAFLEADMKSGEEVYVELDQMSSRILGMIDPTTVPFLDDKGKFVARLDKALYGCIQSARLWFLKLTEVLKSYGFICNPCDPCVMNKMVDEIQITIGFHVDDLIMTCIEDEILDQVSAFLRDTFKEVKEKTDDIVGYLGMRISVLPDGIKLDMDVYTEKVIVEYDVTDNSPTPASEDLFEEVESSLLDEDNKTKFHSCVAKLLYLAKRARPDILLPISHLASRVTSPTDDDMRKLRRVLRYLAGKPKLGLFFKNTGDLSIKVYIDASFAIHSDGRSRTGMVISMGGSTIYAWTSKQKMATKSSCESEIVGLSDGVSEVLGCREFMIYQGYDVGPATIYEDNTSVIDLIEAGKPTSHRSRHMKARYFFLKDYIEAGEITLKHLGTDSMLADYLTKPLGINKFALFRDIVLGLMDTYSG